MLDKGHIGVIHTQYLVKSGIGLRTSRDMNVTLQNKTQIPTGQRPPSLKEKTSSFSCVSLAKA